MRIFRKLSVSTVTVLLLIVSNAYAVNDKRITVLLDERERFIILNQMHYYLSGVIKITEALSREDMQAVAKAAKLLGRAMPKRVPDEMLARLPTGFRQIGASVHKAFDQMALDAEGFGDSKYALKQLSDTIAKCHACHATYQIRSSTYDPLAH